MEDNAWKGLYRLLASIGMPKPAIPCKLANPKGGKALGTVSIGWPELRIALAQESDTGGEFKRHDWTLIQLSRRLLDSVSPLLKVLDQLPRPSVATSAPLMPLSDDEEGLPRSGPTGASPYGDEAWNGLYRLLKGIGMPRPQVPCRLDDLAYGAAEAAMGWPELATVLALDTDQVESFEAAGWTVVSMTNRLLDNMKPLLALLDELAFERVIRDSENSTKITVSTIEATALRALLKAGLPMPQREIGFYRGSERAVTVPDFAWPEARLAVYVDGIYWHGGQDLQQAMLAAAGADKEREQQLQDRIKHTVVRDAAKRRYLVSLGWTVCAIAEPEIEAGLMPEIAKEIKAAYHLRMEGATPLAS